MFQTEKSSEDEEDESPHGPERYMHEELKRTWAVAIKYLNFQAAI